MGTKKPATSQPSMSLRSASSSRATTPAPASQASKAATTMTDDLKDMTYDDAKLVLVKKSYIPDTSDPTLPILSNALRYLASETGLKAYRSSLVAIAVALDHQPAVRFSERLQPALDHLESIAVDMNEEELALHTQLDDLDAAHKISRDLIAQQTTLLEQITAVSTQLQSHAAALKKTPAPSYSSALLAAASVSPHTSPVSDPRFVQQIITRQCQILIDASADFTGGTSIETLTGKVKDLLTAEETDRPSGASLDSIQKIRNGGLVLRFDSKETAEWISSSRLRARLLGLFGPGTQVKARGYQLVVPWIPLHFNPDRDSDLREVEGVNGLPEGAILKAKWIKPARRRTPSQMCAFAFFTLSSAELANKLIQNGISVCNKRVYPTKAKKEPVRCLKCQTIGHFMADCRAADFKCGNCGDRHSTDSCTTTDRVLCSTCGSEAHNTFERSCPAYLEKCDQIDERFPENNLRFFPTEEPWTHKPSSYHPANRPSSGQRSTAQVYARSPFSNVPQAPTQPAASSSHASRRPVPPNLTQSTLTSFVQVPPFAGPSQRARAERARSRDATSAARPSSPGSRQSMHAAEPGTPRAPTSAVLPASSPEATRTGTAPIVLVPSSLPPGSTQNADTSESIVQGIPASPNRYEALTRWADELPDLRND